MKRIWHVILLGLAMSFLPATARAQIFTPVRPNPFGTPFGAPFTSSPFYSPLMNRGMAGYPFNSGIGAYPGLQTSTLGQLATPASGTTGTLMTGHPTRFLYYSQYFMNQGGGETPAYVNPFGMGSTGVPGPFGIGTGGAAITPRVILGVQPRPNAR